MKLILFSGFLGSGKTTSILSAAAYIMRNAKKQNPLVILENEVGDIAYDDSLIQSGGLEVRNLLSGCICCTLNTSLIGELIEIEKQYAPEFVIFEPTGVAFPQRILDSVSACITKLEWSTVITVVDALRLPKLMKILPNLIEEQIAAANTILISKTDLISESQANEAVETVRGINPKADIHKPPFEISANDALWEEVLGNND